MRSFLKFFSLVALVVPFASAKADTLISGQFGAPDGFVPYSGVEPDAAKANAVFNAANMWNHLAIQRSGQLTFTNLVDSIGNPTSVGFTTKVLNEYTNTNGNTNDGDTMTGSDTGLPDSYILVNNGASDAFSFTGLTPNTAFTLMVYDYTGGGSRPVEYTIGSDSVSTVNGTPSSEDPNNAVSLILTGVTGANGTIDGTWQSLNDQEADWAGFQLDLSPAVITPPSVTPEPSSLVLLGTGVLGLAGAVRRRLGGK